MKKKNVVLIVLFAVLLFVGIFLLNNRNKLTVDFGDLNPNDFEIHLSLYSADTIYHNPIIIYKDGVYYDIPNEYGDNDWVIYYKGEKQCAFRHYKNNRNWNYSHRYKFAIFEKQDTLYCAINIRGKNSEKDTVVFVEKDEMSP